MDQSFQQSQKHTNELSDAINLMDKKFTLAQQKIVDRLLKGHRLMIVNKHHMSGGSFVWRSDVSLNHEYAGRVYKAFFNIGYTLGMDSGFMSKFIVS
tara:strand:- start:704 stop:994 length:291 start_codon:yes stop_codon:yes gene_type:complete